MDAIGNLLAAIAGSIAGLVERSFRIFGDTIQSIVATLQSILPGPWLPIAAVALVLVVGWNLAKR